MDPNTRKRRSHTKTTNKSSGTPKNEESRNKAKKTTPGDSVEQVSFPQDGTSVSASQEQPGTSSSTTTDASTPKNKLLAFLRGKGNKVVSALSDDQKHAIGAWIQDANESLNDICFKEYVEFRSSISTLLAKDDSAPGVAGALWNFMYPNTSVGISSSSASGYGGASSGASGNSALARKGRKKQTCYYDGSTAEWLKQEVKKTIALRKKASRLKKRYRFKGVHTSCPESAVLGMIINEMFIDKTKAYRACIEQSPSWKLGVLLGVFPRRFGKTTWLSFLEATLGPLLGVKDAEAFYNALSGLREGAFFLQAPIRPVIFLDMVNAHDVRGEMAGLFEQYRIYRIPGSNDDFSIYLKESMDLLQELFDEVREELSQEDRKHVHSELLILIDEFDAPYRKAEEESLKKRKEAEEENTKRKEAADEDTKLKNHYKTVQDSLGIVTESLKVLLHRLKQSIWGVCITSLMPLGRTGLSDLDCSTAISFKQKFHDLFGISDEELFYTLESQQSNTMSLNILVKWARRVGIVNANASNASTRFAVQQLMKWLAHRVNGFCMALDRDEKTLCSLYSPLDIAAILLSAQSMDEGEEPEIPELQWVGRTREIYGRMLQQKIAESDLRHALTGGIVDSSDFNQRQLLSEYFTDNRKAHCALLFFLGLLQVTKVYKNKDGAPKKIVLMPPENSRSLADMVSLLHYGFPSRVELSESVIATFCMDQEKLKEAVLRCVEQGCRRVSADYKGYDGVREIPVQDAIYHCMDEHLHTKNRLNVYLESYIKEGQKRIDIRCVLDEDREDEFTIIIEVKMHRLKTFDNRKGREALEQAADYRRRLKKPSGACTLLAVVMAWGCQEVKCWYGEYAGGIPKTSDLGETTKSFFLC